MASNEGIQLFDPEGVEMGVARIDDSAFVATINPPGSVFHMFEDNREKLRAFLRPLMG